MGYNSKYYKKTGKKISTKDLSDSQLRSIGREPKKDKSKDKSGSSSSAPKALQLPTYSGKGTPEQVAGINKTIADINKSLAEGIDFGEKKDSSGKKIGTVYFTDEGGSVGSRNKAGQLLTTPTKIELPKATPPTVASDIQTGIEDTQVSDTTPPVGDITDAFAGAQGMDAYIKLIQDYQQQAIKQQQEWQKEQQSSLKTLFDSIISPSEARQQAWEETGIDQGEYFAKQEKGIKEIEVLSQEYNNLVAAKDQQIAQTQDAMGSMNFINNQVQQIERNAAPQLNRLSANINAKAATLEAQQGNFAEAQKYVNQAVQDATADAKFKYDWYRETYQINKDSLDRINDIYRDSFVAAVDVAKTQYEEQLAEKQLLGEYMLKYPTAGISMEDSMEDASRKLGAIAGSDVDLTADRKNYLWAVQDGYKGTFADWLGKNIDGGTNFTDIMQQAIDAGATPEQAAREAATASELQGIPVDQKTLSSWTSYARSLAPTPVAQTPLPGATISAPSGTYTKASGEQGITLKSIWGSLFGD